MKLFNPFGLPLAIALASLLATVAHAAASTAALPDFTGFWRLNDQLSDTPAGIDARLRAERTREQATAQLPAAAASSGTPASAQAGSGRGSHGGGHGAGGGGAGHGHGGSHEQKPAAADAGTAVVDTPPPLLANDSLLNVQQDDRQVQVALGGSERLDARLDGVARQSLSGAAVVSIRRDADRMEISMHFDGGTRLDEIWVKSADDHHLVVTEQWTTPSVRLPIVFKRSYDRLDI